MLAIREMDDFWPMYLPTGGNPGGTQIDWRVDLYVKMRNLLSPPESWNNTPEGYNGVSKAQRISRVLFTV